jgi:hypothetical protein
VKCRTFGFHFSRLAWSVRFFSSRSGDSPPRICGSESSAAAQIAVLGAIFLTVQYQECSLPRQEVEVSTWLLSFLVIVSVGILIAHAIDAMRS